MIIRDCGNTPEEATRVAREIILAHPWSFLRVHLSGCLTGLLPNVTEFLELLGVTAGPTHLEIGAAATYADAHAAPSHAHEVLETRWFPVDALPPDIDPGHVRRIPEAFRVWRGDLRAYFDGGPPAIGCGEI